MKLKVVIEDRTYHVEVGDLRTRPVIAVVDGETFEVWPETETVLPASRAETSPTAQSAPVAAAAQPPAVAEKPAGGPPPIGASGPAAARLVRAPLPGVITRLAVQPGDEVESGQELCVLEAMKMNNSIRASQPGRIGTIKVAIGQHVKHGDVLVEYAD